MEQRIAKLRAEEEAAHVAYVAARERLTEAIVDGQPFKLGMRIKSTKGKIAEVVGFKRPYAELEVQIRLVLKNGELGKDIYKACSWDKWAPA